MKRTACIVALLLVSASPTRADDLRLPDKCKAADLHLVAAERLATRCSERIAELDKRRDEQDRKATPYTVLSIVSGIFAAGAAAALIAIPGAGAAIQAADPPRPAVPDDPTTDDDETVPAYLGAGPALAVSQLAVGVATGIFTASAAGFATLAVYFAPSSEEAVALQTDLNGMRTAANNLVLVPVLALEGHKDAEAFLRNAAEKCAIANPKPRDAAEVAAALGGGGMTPSVADMTMATKIQPPPACLPSLEHDKTRKLWMGTDANGARVLLKYVVDEKDKTQVKKVCSLDDTLTEKNCIEDPLAIKRFLGDFHDANP